MHTLIIANKNYSSWSLRPWILMRELNIPFNERLEPFGNEALVDGFKSFSPTGKVPCLIDGARTVWDSFSIAEYLNERHENIWPKDDDARAWGRSVSAEMHSSFQALRGSCPMNVSLKVAMNEPSAALRQDIARIDAIWSEGVKRFGGPFLCGKTYTAVDAFFSAVVFRWWSYGFELSAPATAYAKHILSLPNMQNWQQAGQAEPWRDQAHEDEVLACGRIVSDARG